MRRLLAALVLAAWPAFADEPLPPPAHTSVNDFAAVLTDSDTQVLDEALIALHGRTGIEGTVVTLPDRARYGDATLEGFATRLFNAWGVGDAGRNDGFMVLLAMAEREVRIELGAGYPASGDIRASDIIGRVMVPRLREGEASAALRDGTLAVIETIALPQAGGRPIPVEGQGGGGFMEGLLKAAVFGVFAISGAGILRGIHRRRRDAACPSCGARLTSSENVLTDPLPGGSPATRREVTRRCPACGWSDSRILPLPVVGGGRGHGGRWRGHRGGGGRSGGFGGGRSGGGGASGKW